MSGLSTADLAEDPSATTSSGTMYFTNARARAALSGSTGITYNSTTGAITNSAPDQTVSLTGGGATTVTGTYPNFTISSTDNNTVPNNATITISAGTELSTGGDFTTDQGSNETITINHANVSRADNNSSASPGYGDSFTAIDSITTNDRGHVTAVNTKTVTIPASDNTDTDTVTQIREDSGSYRTGSITLQSGTNVTITEPSAGVFNFASTNTNTTNFNIQADGGATENISAGETINFIGSGTTSVSRSGNSITISSSASTNNFVDGATFNTGNGIITLSRSGLSAVTVDIDGRFINNTSTQPNNIYIRNTSPTIYLRDQDHISSMIHQNSNLFYILRADAADDASWTPFSTSDAANGRWPLQMNLTNSGHYVYFGSPNLQAGGHTVWHAGNDGPGSGLNADVLDSQDGSYYLNYNNFTNTPSIPSAANNATITLNPGYGLTTGGAFTTNQGSNETITLDLDLNELTVASVAESNDHLVIVKNNGATRKMLFSEFLGDQDIITGTVTGTLFSDIISANVITADMIQANSIVATLINADTISANNITTGTLNATNVTISNLRADDITGGVTEVFMLADRGSSYITTTASSLFEFEIPAPQFGIKKHGFVEGDFHIGSDNNNTSNNSGLSAFRYAIFIQKKSRGQTGTSFGTVLATATEGSFLFSVTVSGNYSADVDLFSGVADNNNPGAVGSLEAVEYDITNNRTKITYSYLAGIFTVGETLFVSPDKWGSSGLYLNQVGNTTSQYVGMSYGSQTWYSKFSFRATLANTTSSETYRIMADRENVNGDTFPSESTYSSLYSRFVGTMGYTV